MKITVIGLGLIGGSIALKLKNQSHHIIGVDASSKHSEMAKDLNIVDEIMDIDSAIKDSELIVLSIPVDKMEAVLIYILDNISWNQTIFDVGSTKNKLCEAVKNHEKRSRFIAAHPLAGTEFSGPQAAFLSLFDGKKNIVCEEDKSDEDALELCINIFNDLGMQTLFMNPQEHDKHLAYVSHLSHLSSFVLGQTVLDIEKDEKQILNLAGTGFESTVRLAKSSPETWSAIFDRNAENISTALDSYIEHLEVFRTLLKKNDKIGIKEKMQEANKIKTILKGLKMNIVKLS